MPSYLIPMNSLDPKGPPHGIPVTPPAAGVEAHAVGSVAVVRDPLGPCLDLRGGHVEVAAPELALAGGGLTVSLWVRPEIVEGANRHPAAVLSAIGSGSFGWELRLDKSIQLALAEVKNGQLTLGNNRTTKAAARASEDRWTHLVVAVEAGEPTDTVSVYADGVLLLTRPRRKVAIRAGSDAPLWIGAPTAESKAADPRTDRWRGRVARLQVSDRALEHDEVEGLYQADLVALGFADEPAWAAARGRQADEPLLHLEMDELEEGVLRDLSGNGRDTTVVGGAAIAGDRERGPCLELSQQGQEALLPVRAFRLTDGERNAAMSACAWFKLPADYADQLAQEGAAASHLISATDAGKVLWSVELGANLVVRLAVPGQRSPVELVGGEITPDSWHHVGLSVAVEHGSPGAVVVTLDGAEQTISPPSFSRLEVHGQSGVRLGSAPTGADLAGFRGRLHGLRVYGRAMSAPELSEVAREDQRSAEARARLLARELIDPAGTGHRARFPLAELTASTTPREGEGEGAAVAGGRLVRDPSFGPVLELDSEQTLTLPFASAFRSADSSVQELSLCLWVRDRSLGRKRGPMVLSAEDLLRSRELVWGFLLTDGIAAVLGAEKFECDSPKLIPGRWTHVAFGLRSDSAASSARGWVDGELVLELEGPPLTHYPDWPPALGAVDTLRAAELQVFDRLLETDAVARWMRSTAPPALEAWRAPLLRLPPTEPTDGKLPDATGNERHGVLVNEPGVGPDELFEAALELEPDDAVRLPVSGLLPFDSEAQIGVAGWFKPRRVVTGRVDADGDGLIDGAPLLVSDAWRLDQVQDGVRLSVRDAEANWIEVRSPTVLRPDRWVHIAVGVAVANRRTAAQLFLDGEPFHGSGSAAEVEGPLTSTSTGPLGEALAFDGRAGIEVPLAVQPLPASFTVELWAKRTSPTDDVTLLVSDLESFSLIVTEAGEWSFLLGAVDGGETSLVGPSVVDDRWVHLAGSYDDDTQTATFIVDGVEVARQTDFEAEAGNSPSLCLGGERDHVSFGGVLEGHLTEFRLWDHARDAATMAAESTLRMGGDEPGLASCWPLEGLPVLARADGPGQTRPAADPVAPPPPVVGTTPPARCLELGGGFHGRVAQLRVHRQPFSALEIAGIMGTDERRALTLRAATELAPRVHLPLDDTELRDATRNGHGAALATGAEAPHVDDETFGRAHEFFGDRVSHAVLPLRPAWPSGDGAAFTVDVWVKHFLGVSDESCSVIATAGASGPGWRLGLDAKLRVEAELWVDGGWHTLSTDRAVSARKWTHLALAVSQSQAASGDPEVVAQLYAEGQPLNTPTVIGRSLGYELDPEQLFGASRVDVHFGSPDTGRRRFEGRLAHLRIFDCALSEQDLLAAWESLRPGVAMVTSYGIEFQLYTRQFEEPTFYLLGGPHQLTLEITNASPKTLVIDPGSMSVVSMENHHFELRFRKGTLKDPEGVTIEGPEGWKSLWRDERSANTADYANSLYLLRTSRLELAPGETHLLRLGHVAFDARGGARGTRVQLRWKKLSQPGAAPDLTGTRTHYVHVLNQEPSVRTLERDFPLRARIAGAGTVLNDNISISRTTILIECTRPEGWTIPPGAADRSPKIVIEWDDAAPWDSNAPGAWTEPTLEKITGLAEWTKLEGSSGSDELTLHRSPTGESVFTRDAPVRIELKASALAQVSGAARLTVTYKDFPHPFDLTSPPIEVSQSLTLHKGPVDIADRSDTDSVAVEGIKTSGVVGLWNQPALRFHKGGVTENDDDNLVARIEPASATSDDLQVTSKGDLVLAPRTVLEGRPVPGPASSLRIKRGTKTASKTVVMTTDNVNELALDTNLRVNGELRVRTRKSKSEPDAFVHARGYGVPAGTIVMWSGTRHNVPDGWVLCEGGTVKGVEIPDLQGRFIAGASDSGDFARGKHRDGQKEMTLKEKHIPQHGHNVSVSQSAHTHSFTASENYRWGTMSGHGFETLRKESSHDSDESGTLDSHKISGTTDSATPTLTVTQSKWGGENGTTAPFDLRPAYYAICFIMKLPD